MGQTLIRGLISGGVISKDRVWAGDKNSSACSKAVEALDVPAETDFQHRVPKSDLILICVKPADAPDCPGDSSQCRIAPRYVTDFHSGGHFH